MPALESLRIQDMTLYLAGVFCSQEEAWVSADVVKIVEPEGMLSSKHRAIGAGS